MEVIRRITMPSPPSGGRLVDHTARVSLAANTRQHRPAGFESPLVLDLVHGSLRSIGTIGLT